MLTQTYRKETTVFSCIMKICRSKTTRKIFCLMLLILSLVMIESYAVLKYGWKEAIKQSPFTIIFLGIALVQVCDNISALVKTLHRTTLGKLQQYKMS